MRQGAPGRGRHPRQLAPGPPSCALGVESDKLIEDAQRDWSALGQERLLFTPLSRFAQGRPIRFDEGILFTTYATLRSAERDGKASRVQQIVDWLGRDFDGVVSTGEALMERRLAEIPTAEWADLSVDITPREYVLDYLAHSFPTQLFEPFTDGDGNLSSRRVLRDGQPVESREAVERRDRMIEKLASLPPVAGALDQLVQRFGTEQVAEVTGRSRRIVRKVGSDGVDRLAVEARAGSANLAEAQAFMDDAKRILVFSDAGGTGRSYHADLGAKNRRLRVHYLLEPGWKADAAIQGLGRTNRTNQGHKVPTYALGPVWAAACGCLSDFS